MLEDESEAAILDAGVRELFPGDRHVSGVRLLEPGDHPKDGALSGTAGAEQSGDGSLGGGEADVVNGLERRRSDLLSPLTSMLPAITAPPWSCCRLNVSIPIRRTIENSASVRATT